MYPDILDVIEKLNNGMSLNALSKEIGKDRKTLKRYYEGLGYTYVTELRNFVKKKIEPSVTESNTNDDKYKDLEQRLKALEDIVMQMQSKSPKSDFELDSRVLKNDIMIRSIKVSKNAMDAFTKVAENKLSMYSKQDLISQALLEFTDKYK